MRRMQRIYIAMRNLHRSAQSLDDQCITSVENSRGIINTILSAPETYAVLLKSTGRSVGSIGLMIGKQSDIGLPNDECEIGYWIGVPYWGQGLIPEAVRELQRRAFNAFGMKKI